MPQKVEAVSFISKLSGSSQPSIVWASDGHFYVLKYRMLASDRSLLNEAVGAQLLTLMGLPAPAWIPLHVSDSFLDRNPGAWFQKSDGAVRPSEQLCFGSRVIEAEGDCRTYQLIPRSWIPKINNRAHFLGALIFDLWTNNCDRRQAVFLTDAQCEAISAVFIDNDYLFGGPSGTDKTCPLRAMVYDLQTYAGLWDWLAVSSWLDRIDKIDHKSITRILEAIPEEWADETSRQSVVDQLEKRRLMLPALIDEAKHLSETRRSIGYRGTRHATAPFVLY